MLTSCRFNTNGEKQWTISLNCIKCRNVTNKFCKTLYLDSLCNPLKVPLHHLHGFRSDFFQVTIHLHKEHHVKQSHAHIDHTRGWLILCNQHVSGKIMIIAEGHRFLRINTKLSVAAIFTPVKKLCKSFSCLTCIGVRLFTCLSFCWLRSQQARASTSRCQSHQPTQSL